MIIIKNTDKSEWPELFKRPALNVDGLYDRVQEIICRVREEGDQALFEYERMFDSVNIQNLSVSESEIAQAGNLVSNELKDAIHIAAENIRKFHMAQLPNNIEVETTPGVVCWQKAVPVSSVGLYIPGGTAPLFSTVLMLAIPATIAGCDEIIICSPPNKEGNIDPAILYAADLAGVNTIFKLGGSQAIAAMAYGTQTVPKVNKIFGPGNAYVTTAKQIVSLGDVAIDMPAGPSEVLVIADDSANPVFVAADLLSQAEHGADSQVILATTSEQLINNVQKEVEIQLAHLPRMKIACESLKNSRLVLMPNMNNIVEFTNWYAPEHLIIQTESYVDIVDNIRNAGSVFLGPYSPESVGDYASGTNHTLPTSGYAKAYSGVNIDSFIKKITFQELSLEGLRRLGPVVQKLAEAESLEAHKNAIAVRLNKK